MYEKSVDKVTKLFFKEFIGDKKESFKSKIKNNELKTYKAVYPVISEDIKAFYKMNIKNVEGCKESIPKNGKTWVLRFPYKNNIHPQLKMWDNPPELTKDELIEKCVEFLKEMLPQFCKNTEYQTEEIDYESVEGNKYITSLSLRLRRIFKGGVITRNFSYIYVKVDGWGNLSEIKICWPVFVENSLIESRKMISTKSVLSKARDISENMPKFKFNDGKEGIVKTVNLIDVACAWAPQNGDYENNILVPSMSFIQNIVFKDGYSFHKYLEIPIFENN